ncbi:unnamed protein product [Didymodactylos carnosus]|uniref:Uncharacterized protein n=1 Tax=Didymodactylos carnosus TaxID=1234261 RepID=A0A814IHB4_9BILA|nr:unnamed protein product [Didymodactylos carnosus]CAF1022765.1 unnamed protein product [Didymodactylos carnosus]CAF3608735.1 unnamed protein product [Didymodactylos carnosus]CAF3794133.1 unnamed protein product [Didymodactylos carnosus]
MQLSTIYDAFYDNASFPLLAIIGYFPPPPLIPGPPPKRLWCKKNCIKDYRDPSKINEPEINLNSTIQLSVDNLLTTNASIFDIRSTSKYISASSTPKSSITDLLLNRLFLMLSILLLVLLVVLNIVICTYFLIYRSRRRRNRRANEINNNYSNNTNDILLNNTGTNDSQTLFTSIHSRNYNSDLKKMNNKHHSDAIDAGECQGLALNEQDEEEEAL